MASLSSKSPRRALVWVLTLFALAVAAGGGWLIAGRGAPPLGAGGTTPRRDSRLPALITEAEADPENPAPQLLLGEAYLESGDPVAALPYLARAARDERTAGEASLLLAQAAAAPPGQALAAFSAADAAVKAAPGDPKAWEGRIRVLYLLNQRGSAGSQLDEAIRRFPDAPRLQFLRAQILEQDSKNREALGVYEAALRKHPDADGFILQALLLGKMRAPQRSRVAFLNALKLDPNSLAAQLGLVQVNIELGFLPEAEKAAQAALKLDPQSAEALYLNGRVLVEKGPESHGPARDYLERALAREPGHAEARYYLGVLKLRAGDAAGAARELEQVVSAQPDRIDARQNYAKALRQSGDVKNAAIHEATAGELARLDSRHSQLSNRVSLRPNDPESHCDLGDFYLQHGALPKAVREYERALALKPGHPRAQVGLQKARSAAP